MHVRSHRKETSTRWSRCRLAALGLGTLLGLLPVAAAQQQAAPKLDAKTGDADAPTAAEVQFTVRRAPERREMITVPVNQGVLVDFNQPVREVRVASPEIADVSVLSPKQIMVEGKTFGTTQLLVTINGGRQQVFTVAVDLDLERLQAGIEQNVPRAKVKATGMLDTVILTGTVPDAQSAERIMQIADIYTQRAVNQMNVAGVQQVLLRCTVAEVNRTATRELGFNGWIAGDNSPDIFGVSQLAGINPVNIGAAADASVTGRIPFLTDQAGLPLSATPTLSFGFPRVQMQIFIQALRENNLLQVLAEPNLVTVSGEQANFLAGGEIPIPVPQRDSVTIEYREYGVRLNFTPTVLGNNIIRLRVAPEVSEPDFSTAVQLSGFVVPGLTQRRVETVVELGAGQTFAIGGLLSERARAVSSKVPALGDIPVLGALFTSVSYQSAETELVVLVTPELVEPLNPGQIGPIPGADHIPPNDWELFALGQIEGKGDPQEAKASANAAVTSSSESYTPPTALRLRGPIGPAGSNEGT